MASSEADFAEFSAMFERMIQESEGFARFLPMILAVASEADSDDQETNDRTTRQREIVIDAANRRVVMMRSGTGGFDGFFTGAGKEGRSPASKASVESMPRVVIGEDKEEKAGGGSCSICLDEWSEGDVAAEMPCKHKFHSKCVEEWLGRHATCPLCRYEMPVEEEQEEGKTETVGVWIGFSVNGGEGRRQSDSNTRDETEA